MAGESADAAARRTRDKIARLERVAESWERGAEGERIVGTLLEQLPRESWAVFHDLRWPGRQRANIDHVVVGPPGVFVIDAKNWSGTIDMRNGVLRQNGYLRQGAVEGADQAARAVAGVATSTSPVHVHPVLCFVTHHDVAGRSGGVLLCSTTDLLETLVMRPPVLTEATRARVCRDIDAYMRPAVYPAQRRSPSPPWSPSVPPSAIFPWRMARRAVAAVACFAFGIGGLVMVAGELPDLRDSLMGESDQSERPRHQKPEKPRKHQRQNQPRPSTPR